MATILIVDDLAADREFLLTLLRSQGHRVLEAADGREALGRVLAGQWEIEAAVPGVPAAGIRSRAPACSPTPIGNRARTCEPPTRD